MRLATHRGLGLRKLCFLAGPLAGYVHEFAADRIELLAVDCLRPGRTARVVGRRFLVQPVLLTVLLHRRVRGPQLSGERAYLLLKPVMGFLHRGEFFLPLKVEVMLRDFVGDPRTESWILRRDHHVQHAGSYFIGKSDLRSKHRGRDFDECLLRRRHHLWGRYQAAPLQQRPRLENQPPAFRLEFRDVGQMLPLDNTTDQRGRTEYVDLGTHQTADIAGIWRDSLQVAHLRALWFNKDCRFGCVQLRHVLDEGDCATDAQYEGQQNDPEMAPQDRF